VLGRSPALLETLEDPSVRQLVEDPSNLDQIAMMLRAAAMQQAPPRSPDGNGPSDDEDA